MKRSIVPSLLVTVLLTGCASWFMNGGKLVDKGYSPSAKASYSVPGCTTIADKSPIQGPQATYLLVQDGADPGLFERSADGSGAVIQNHWSDDQGDHFFGWVQSSGWEYVLPKDPSAPGTRIVYTGLKTSAQGGITKPASQPVATCPMVPKAM